MDRTEYIDDIMKKLRTIVEGAFDRGVSLERERVDATRKTILEALGVPDGATAPRGAKAHHRARRTGGQRAAPVEKGVVTSAIAKVMREHDGISTKQAEEFAFEINGTIKKKSVYNELWRQREKGLYVQRDGKWYNATSIVNGQPIDLLNRPHSAEGATHGDAR